MGSQGVCGASDKGYLLSGNCIALVIILGELGSNLIDFGILGALSNRKKIEKEKPPFCLIFKKAILLATGCCPQIPLVKCKRIHFRTIDIGNKYAIGSQKKYRLGTVSKKSVPLLQGLNMFDPYFRCGSRRINVWFA